MRSICSFIVVRKTRVLLTLVMGKARGVTRRRKKKFNYNVNRKKLHKKALQLPKITCKQIQGAWNPKRSYRKNMKDMGLSADPNQSLPVSSAMEIGTTTHKVRKDCSKSEKMHVVEDLESEALVPQPKMLRLPIEVVKFCIYMIEKYGEDYKAMSRDPKNHYQETPNQIKKKINKLKNIPRQWNGYLRAKGLLQDSVESDEDKIDINEIMEI